MSEQADWRAAGIVEGLIEAKSMVQWYLRRSLSYRNPEAIREVLREILGRIDSEIKCGQEDPQFFQGGISMRDYFAAKAISLFSLDNDEVRLWLKGQKTPLHDKVAEFCYQVADAMLEERQKGQK